MVEFRELDAEVVAVGHIAILHMVHRCLGLIIIQGTRGASTAPQQRHKPLRTGQSASAN